MPPEEQSIRSTPRAASSRASKQLSAIVQPSLRASRSSRQSTAEMRKKSDLPTGQTLRTLSSDFEREPHTAIDVAAIGIAAAVGDGRQKRVQQITVGAVYLQNVEVGLRRTTCALAKVLNKFADPSIVSDRGSSQPSMLGSAETLTGLPGWFAVGGVRCIEGPNPCQGRRRDAFGPQ